MVPSPDDIDITKLGEHAGLIMTDSCNAAQKARRLLQHKIGGNIYELDCHHHLCNVWIKGMEQSVSSFLRVIVTDSLEKIPPKLRVTCVYSAIAIEKKSLGKAEEALVEASYYWDMYFSDVCWKGKQSIVKTMLARLRSESAKVEALKENIRMRVLGLGWKQFAITWSQKGVRRSVDELAMHLKMIIREQRKLTPPTDPALEMPKRAELPILGTATKQLLESKDTAKIDEKEFRERAAELRMQREARGEGSIFSVMQPLYCPELDELMDKRIDVLYSFQLDSGEKVLRWCQGKVI